MISFKTFITEAYAAGGFAYEDKIANILKAKGYMDPNAATAGSSGSAADATIKGQNLEVKQSKSAMFGQTELVYDKKTKTWDFSPRSKTNYPATVKKLTDAGVLKTIKAKWGNPTGVYETDLKKMGNLYIDVSSDTIAAHYAKDRKTPYIQVGGYGLFKFTNSDPAQLGVKLFKPTARARARVKYRGKGSYGFLVVLLVSAIATKSNIDIDSADFQ